MPKNIVIRLADVKPGQRITVQYRDANGTERGHGGVVQSLDRQELVTRHGDFPPIAYPVGLFATTHWIETEVPFVAADCMQYTPEECSGPVDYHSVGRGRSWLRCQAHARIREQHYATSMERYADSAIPPSWFDPTYAGERWNEED